MRDVASEAGVSIATVSNVINAREGEVAASTRDRVLQAMEELGYRPNLAARGLRSQRQRTLAFLVLDEGARFLADPMTDEIIAGIGDIARARSYSVLIQASRPGPLDEGLLAPLLEQRADGACLLLSGPARLRRSYAARLVELGFPCVAFEQLDVEGAGCVTADNYRGALKLVEHLVARGHRRIGFVSTRVSWPMVEERLRGYRDGLRAAGITADRSLVVAHGTWDPASGSEMGAKLLDLPKPPTAIIAGNDLLALGVMRAAHERGVAIPDRLAVAGFNDFTFSAFVEPTLTTVAIAGYDMGRIAGEMLVDRLDRGVPPAQVTLPVELIVRGSA